MQKQETDYKTVKETKTALWCDHAGKSEHEDYCMGKVGYAEDGDSLIRIFGRPTTRPDTADNSEVVDADVIKEICEVCYSTELGTPDSLDSGLRPKKEVIARASANIDAKKVKDLEEKQFQWFTHFIIVGVIGIMTIAGPTNTVGVITIEKMYAYWATGLVLIMLISVFGVYINHHKLKNLR